MRFRHLRKIDFVRSLLFLAMVLCGLYIFVGIMMACGAYKHLGAVDPILVITYVSIVHIIALPLLYTAIGTTCGKPVFYIIFLVLNAAFIIGLLIAVCILSLSAKGRQHQQWTSNPLNHILCGLYMIDAVLLELLVGLYYRDIKREAERNSPRPSTATAASASSLVSETNSPPPGTATGPPPEPPKRHHKRHHHRRPDEQSPPPTPPVAEDERYQGGRGQTSPPGSNPDNETPKRPPRSPKPEPPPVDDQRYLQTGQTSSPNQKPAEDTHPSSKTPINININYQTPSNTTAGPASPQPPPPPPGNAGPAMTANR